MRIPQIILEKPNVTDLMEAISIYPKEYTVYVSFCDSLYLLLPQETEEYEDNELYLHSMDTQGKSEAVNCLQELIEVLENFSEKLTVRLSPAENLDIDLDMQMEEDCDIIGISIDYILKDVYLIAG